MSSVSGNQTITGNNQTFVVYDGAGSSNQRLAGNNNAVQYLGDEGANTFRVGGNQNLAQIANLGGDDKVILDGKKEDWTISQGSAEDGSVTLTNKKTGTTVTVATDDGRDDAFVLQRVGFADGAGAATDLPPPADYSKMDIADILLDLFARMSQFFNSKIAAEGEKIANSYGDSDDMNGDLTVQLENFKQLYEQLNQVIGTFKSAIDKINQTRENLTR